jgi:membrane-bound lytic murein transglycosylase D
VIESGLEARAVSSAGAEGWWQFMLATGNRYGLERTNYIDDRRSLERSTDAAIRHFRDLYDSLGSWPLVLSAYNAGERRVRQSMEEQGETSFYDLVLPTETEAYWFKAAAAKLLLGSPERFQLQISEDGWAPAQCDTLDVRVLVNRLDLRTLTASSDLTYREIKGLNPWIRRSYLPLGNFRLVVPSRHSDAVVASLDGAKLLRRAVWVEDPMLAQRESEEEVAPESAEPDEGAALREP